MKVRFTGNFWEFLVFQVLWTILTFITFGLFAFYQAYWTLKYYFDHLEIDNVQSK